MISLRQWKKHRAGVVDSPTKHVGGTGGKVTHPYKLYSLQKVYDEEEIEPWKKDVKLPKIDGTNLTLIYRRVSYVWVLLVVMVNKT